MKNALRFVLVAAVLLSLAAALTALATTTRLRRSVMHALVARIGAARAARRVRQAEQIHAAREDRRRRTAPPYAFGTSSRWAVA
jgi:hypothetical protein